MNTGPVRDHFGVLTQNLRMKDLFPMRAQTGRDSTYYTTSGGGALIPIPSEGMGLLALFSP
jgi:hypothetical protein